MSRRSLNVGIRIDREALAVLAAGDVTQLTQAATGATFYRDDLTDEQRTANRRVVDISEPTARAAAGNANQHFAAAFVDGAFAGYVIATRHGPNNQELDWLMVHPDYHGTNVAEELMRAGIEWLGKDKPMWLNVIRHNTRAIRFYERFGFSVDPTATTAHIVPHVIMRRMPR
ncbi:MAG: GNAT family N-acetyltransferase [Alphaproteobacteria bacterium]|jgi:ribosomal protein S18 acetylase RimI-like enzyme|nr:GNAT family N-acetyltransferase [Alphaproteobacteria bacterium]